MAREVIDIIIQERGGRQVSGSLRNIGASAGSAQGAVMLLRRALGGLSAGLALRNVLQTIDSYQRLQNQLRVVGYETNQLANATKQLFDISQRTRTPLEQMGNLYGKLAQSAGELGKSEAEMMRFTELTGKALAIQGTSANGARGALLQLSQAMGEGIVRAQEYNSLVENARPLLLAAATGMEAAGGSVAKLRALVVDGKVTSEQFFDAVLKGGEILEEQFGNTVPTISQALTKLNNAWTYFIGESAIGQTILATVSGILIFMADNFETLAAVIIGAGTAFALYWGSGVLTRFVTGAYDAARAQVAVNMALAGTGAVSAIARVGLSGVTGALRVLTLAIMANPLGFLLVAITSVLTYLYTLRAELVTVGNSTATVGSIMEEVWDRTKVSVKDFTDSALTWLSDMTTQVSGWFSSIGIDGRAMANFLIAVIKSMVDIWVGQFRVLYEVAVAVFQGIAAAGKSVSAGVSAAMKGDFAAAGAAFGDAFSKENFNFDGVVAAAQDTAKTVGSNFGRDFIGELGGAIDAGKTYVADRFEGVVAAAAERDKLKNLEVDPFEFKKIGGAPGDGDDGKGGKGKKGREKLSDYQKEYKRLVDETSGALEKLVLQQQVLDQALADGVVNQEQYTVKQQEIRKGLAEWALEGHNAAGAIREANDAILQLKIDAGQGSFADGFLLGLSRMTEGATNFTANAGSLFSDFFSDFTDGFANSIGRAIVYSEDLNEALRNVANEALASLISGLVKMGIQWLLNAAIGQSVAAAATAATVAQAGAAAGAWAPAAALASLATSGANAAPASAALATTTALATALAQTGKAFADGGPVSGPGGPRDDKILARLSDGEFVVNAKATKENYSLLDALNRGINLKRLLPTFANGGKAVVGTKKVATPIGNRASSDVAAMEKTNNMNGNKGSTNVDVPVKIVNVDDPDAALNALQTSKGERMILNVLERNPSRIKAMLR